MKNIAVFASGRGSNFSAIHAAIKKGKLKANLMLLVCDNPKAGVIRRAKKAQVKIALIPREDYEKRSDFEAKIIQELKLHHIDLIVLAGFMRLLSSEFVHKFKGRILNIHPSLLPSFKGTQGIKDAYDYGVKVTGVTVHFVDEKLDHGPIILQEPIKIEAKDNLMTLERKIHRLEHKIYPQAIRLYLEGRLFLRGRKVKIKS